MLLYEYVCIYLNLEMRLVKCLSSKYWQTEESLLNVNWYFCQETERLRYVIHALHIVDKTVNYF